MKDLRINDVVSVTLNGLTVRRKNGEGVSFTVYVDDIDYDLYLHNHVISNSIVTWEKATLKPGDTAYVGKDLTNTVEIIAVDCGSAWVRSHQTGDRRVFDLTELTRVSE